MAKAQRPQITTLTAAQLEALLAELRPLVPAATYQLIAALLQTLQWIMAALEQKTLSIARLKRLLHHDDTTMRVHSLRQQRTQAPPPPEGRKRTGIFTTSIVSQAGAHPVALFFTGEKHAGENLDQLLQRRAAGLDQPLQMCDGLSRNHSKEFETILCNCILHGRRMFVDMVDDFPDECRFVVESLRDVYRVDAQAKEQTLSDTARLALHQEHSRPVMDRLHAWMNEQFEQRKVEPNSGLGEAVQYMLKRWEPLTRFLEVPGAPLDNNRSERALKMAILHRRNSLAYKTLNGARVGDVFMSLIHTCQLNQINPFEYLVTLQEHSQEVSKDPTRWLPWNYTEALTPADTS